MATGVDLETPRLVARLDAIQAGLFPENHASLALHEACGFRVVGRRERLGKHHGVWRDVLLVERRSGAIV